MLNVDKLSVHVLLTKFTVKIPVECEHDGITEHTGENSDASVKKTTLAEHQSGHVGTIHNDDAVLQHGDGMEKAVCGVGARPKVAEHVAVESEVSESVMEGVCKTEPPLKSTFVKCSRKDGQTQKLQDVDEGINVHYLFQF